MRATVIFLSIFLFLSTQLFAQKEIDSLSSLIKNSTDKHQNAEWLFEICKIGYESTSPLTLNYLEELLSQIDNLNDEQFSAKVLHFSGIVYRKDGDYDKAVECDFKALKLAESTNDLTLQAKLINNIGVDFFRLKDFEKAIKYFTESREIYLKINDSLGLGDAYNNIGMIYDEMLNFDSAMIFYEKAKQIYIEIDQKDAIADALNNIAGVYYRLQDFDNVLKNILQSLDIIKELGDKHRISSTLINIGILYHSIEDYKKAIQYETEGIQLAKEIGYYPLIAFGSKNISESYAKINDYKNAYNYHVEYSIANDTLFNKDMVTSMNEMQTKYETEKKQQQIEILEQESKINKLQIQRIKLLWLSSLIVIILILVIIIILIKINKNKAKINELLKEKNEELNVLNATKDKFFAIISHDLKNPLSAFYSITDSINNYFDEIEKEELHSYIKELKNSSEQLKNLLYDLLQWSAIQSKKIDRTPEKTNIQEIVSENLSLLKLNIESKKHTIYTQIDKELFVYANKNMLTTILRNLISNAIKFTPENGEISISSHEENNKIKISVKDNGIGITKEDINKLFKIDVDTKSIGHSGEKGTGLGLILVKEMVESLEGEINVESKIEEGSNFIITLPVNDSENE